MQRWWLLAIRSWQAKPGRALAAVVSVALGVATVVSVTCFYESVRVAIAERVVTNWLGRSHLSIEHFMGHWGQIPQAMADEVQKLELVSHVTCRSQRQMYVITTPAEEMVEGRVVTGVPVDVVGIDPKLEYEFRPAPELKGRILQEGDERAALMEEDAAAESNLKIGDSIRLANSPGAPITEFELVGTFKTKRLAKFQRSMIVVPLEELQRARNEPGMVSVIDVMLKDPTEDNLSEAVKQVEAVCLRHGHDYQVTNAKAKLQQLNEAQENTKLILLLVAVIAMLTSFFIILTTMGMGIVERIRILGVMRCLGVTRAQLSWLIALEILPLGILGTLIGVPLGLGFTYGGSALVPQYIHDIVLSTWGIKVGAVGGVLTTAIVALSLAIRTGTVSPLAAASPQSRAPKTLWTVVAAVGGIILIAVHEWLIQVIPAAWWYEPMMAMAGLATIYGGYVLIAPALVATFAAAFAQITGTLLGVRGTLAKDPMHKATWRGAGICWMLMVGLSLIVYIGVRSESIMAAWNFPSQLPETFVWSPNAVSREVSAAVEAIPGVKASTTLRDIPCEIGRPDEKKKEESWLDRLRGTLRGAMTPGTFVAGDPETFLSMAKMGFLSGNMEDVRDKLEKGGYVLVPPQAARAHNLKLGDKVAITINGRTAELEVAGIVQSPAMDIAVSYFEAESYMMVAAAGSVLGTRRDLQHYFGVDDVSMFMCNIEFTPQPTPPEFEAEEPPVVTEKWMADALIKWHERMRDEAPELATLVPILEHVCGVVLDYVAVELTPDQKEQLHIYVNAMRDVAVQWDALPPNQRWAAFREQAILRKIANAMGRPDAILASVRRLRESILSDIRQAITLVTIIPAVGLAVAALGVANLMVISVNTRSREIAIMRAVGGTRDQIVRLILAEALGLGLVGCVAGILLGLHSAHTMNSLTAKIMDFAPVYTVPWPQVWIGVAATLAACLLGGIWPSRYAARNDIIGALQGG